MRCRHASRRIERADRTGEPFHARPRFGYTAAQVADPGPFSTWGGVAAGAAMGVVVSALGAGGSLFIVPVLLYLFHEPLPSATGTSLAVVAAAAAVGAVWHWRMGHVRKRVALRFGAASMAVAPLGAWAHQFVPERVGVALFAAALIAASARMVLGPPLPREDARPLALATLLPLGAGVGLLTGFLGVGGGFMIVPALTWGARLPIRHAVGTSLLVIAATSTTGAIGYAAEGQLSPTLLVTVGGGAIAGALVGAPVASALPEAPVRYAFACMAALVALYMLGRAFLG